MERELRVVFTKVLFDGRGHATSKVSAKSVVKEGVSRHGKGLVHESFISNWTGGGFTYLLFEFRVVCLHILKGVRTRCIVGGLGTVPTGVLRSVLLKTRPFNWW